ncbi:Copper chaperone PCu(A)C [Roseovarius sp. EC-HK134]|uniref:copper chaperone PCu(A)C n=1 Tax=Roseovarius TaxID=74030 RepID=UPI001256D81B|nr:MULTISPECIES: copper chaperone PCu(A)C [unclassified Roseovarius]VVT32827.1 Copper chaperone PCu(A)C [Roseovarius sp. EC-HK134]VVT32917.1 Copper chaperone PCu(A)C [Roseovarius sp. EC-SD190]|tara:strand:- start:3991 stop:4467 length:477 start_codon:yes stop_codon:yes gene_type:complete
MSFKSTLLAAFATTILAVPALAQEIQVLDTYARSASPTAKTGAAFMLIENIGDTDDRLIGAVSPAAQRVELHTHIEESGVMKMVHVEEGFAITAGQTLVLERGGAHVMLMGLTESFEQGKIIPITLLFEKSGEIVVDVPVDLARKPEEGHGKAHGTKH